MHKVFLRRYFTIKRKISNTLDTGALCGVALKNLFLFMKDLCKTICNKRTFLQSDFLQLRQIYHNFCHERILNDNLKKREILDHLLGSTMISRCGTGVENTICVEVFPKR